MNKLQATLSLAECKIQASLLLKSLRSSDFVIAHKAAKRFLRLPEFTDLSLTEILQTDIKRKHALNVIALEKGFTSWTALKTQINFIIGGFLNKWFVNYADAKAHLTAEGGFLLPYKKQFFICEAAYIKQLGFNPNDSDCQIMSYDWQQPTDQAAWQRLYKKWLQIQGG